MKATTVLGKIIDLTVATTILEQLGGRRFMAMTGAHSFNGEATSLTFKIPQTPDRIFAVQIVLTPADVYTVTFWKKLGRFDVERGPMFEDVYADQLQEIFTRVTGLDTRL